MKQYIIIGNGIAAVGCIEGIRSKDKNGAITVISKENHSVYCRPLISYYLEGKTDLNKMSYRTESFYADNDCKVIYDVTATAVDNKSKSVSLSNGSTVKFSSLCVATGSSPFVPTFEGLETVKNRFGFMTLDDTLALEKAITAKSRVLIIGAGLIGLKCAEGLRGRVKSITVCDLSDKILSSILDSETAPIVQQHLENNGIEFLMEDSVAKFENNKATMKNGKIIDFDILVTAVGVRANTALIANLGGKVNRGIVVDSAMRTSLDDIYAAGDCTEGYDVSLGENRVLALLPNAYMQGFTAGVNMAGGDETFNTAIPMNSIGLFGMHVITAGSYIAEKDGGTVYTQTGEDFCKRFFVRGGLLKGYILVNVTQRVGIYTSLVRDQTPLDTVNFDLLIEDASFMAFSASNRNKKFGSVV